MYRILFAASDNTQASGAFQSMAKLCQLINENPDFHAMVVLPRKGNGYELLEKLGIEYTYAKSYGWIVPVDVKWTTGKKLRQLVKKIINAFAVRKIEKIIREKNIDILHSNTSYIYVGQKAALRTHTLSVWHLRELLEEDQHNKFCSKDCIKLINKADAVVAISDCIAEKYKSGIKNLVKISNGLDPAIYYYKKQFSQNNPDISLLCIGNMNGGKGQDIIIKACRLLIKSGIRNFHVNFVGSGTKEASYKNLCSKLQLDEFITFHGIHKDVQKFYRKSDIMIMSSNAEAFGRTTVEAMMSGCLIVGSDSGATPEILNNGEFGYMFKNGDYNDLYKVLKNIFADRSCIRDMAEKGQQHALECYSAQLNAEKVMSLYRKLLES